jgi:3-phytase
MLGKLWWAGIVVLAVAGCGGGDDEAAEATPVALQPVLETANESGLADMDDPSVWLHPTDKSRSLVIAAAKRGGLRVFDLQARQVQRVDIAYDGAGEPANRFNNVDVQYGFDLQGTRVDLVVASDRLQDGLRIWKVDATSTTSPLQDITDPAIGRTFPTRPDPADRLAKTMVNPNDGDNTAYGLALWRDRTNDKLYALVAQNNEAVVSMFELVARPGGSVGMQFVKTWQFPYVWKGQDLTQESDTDPAHDFSPQFEGMVVDQQTGVLYAGQEDVGIWRVNLKTRVAEAAPFVVTTAFDPQSPIARDVEGLTMYYAANGKGYLIASSQGQSHGEAPTLVTPGRDDTFAVFARDGGNAYLGSFAVPKNTAAGIDGVQECDGADVTNVSLPGFPGGLLITQDGYNDDLNGFDGEEAATNLKFTPWAGVAANFPGAKLVVDTSYDPRNP